MWEHVENTPALRTERLNMGAGGADSYLLFVLVTGKMHPAKDPLPSTSATG